MNISCEGSHKTVLVTGFGPFISNGVETKLNASGEAVKLMDRGTLESRLNISLITKRIPVEYNYVDKIIPKMWQQYHPHLTIHVGVSDETNGFTLEKQARRAQYYLPDNVQRVPSGEMNPLEGPETIITDLQLELICNEYNAQITESCLKADVSNEAGLFICEYVYYTSLCQQSEEYKSSLFIHVPSVQCQAGFEVIARGLERIVEICVRHLRAQDGFDGRCLVP